MANNVDRLSRNVHRIVERADIQIPPAPKFPVEAVTGPTINRMAAVARFNGDLQKWRNDRWSVDAPFVTEAELSRSITKLSEEQALLTTRLDVGLLDLAELEARVTALETSVTNIDARVTILESAVGTAVPHTILDATVHTDSVTQTVTRGALIYGNAALKWDLLAIGPSGTYVRSDGIDAAWSSVVATEITGVLPVSSGGTNTGSWTAGSVIFAGAGGTSLTEDNANLFWDDTNNRLGIKMNAPLFPLHVGVGLTTAANDLVYFTDTRTAQGPLECILELKMDANPTSYSALSGYAGLEVNTDSKAANTVGMGLLIGCNFKANHRGTGTADAVFGVKGAATNIGAGTVTEARGMSSRVRNLNAAGTIVNGYNYYVETPSLIGPITNQYGFYLNNMGGAGATNVYGIYNVGQSGASTNNFFIYSVSGTSYFGGNVGVLTSTPSTELTVSSTSGADPRGIMSAQYSTDAVGARIHFRKARGTEAAPTTIVVNDILGRIRFSGYDGANYLQMASIDVGSSNGIAATRIPTYMAFSTATNAVPSVITERMRILSGGEVGIGTTTPQTALSFPTGSTGITLYNTADMTVNYERGLIAWVNSRLEIGTQKGGSGSNREVNFLSPVGSFLFGRTSGTAGRFEMNVETLLSGTGLNLISFRPSGAVTAAGQGTVWTTQGFYFPTTGSSASYSWFGIYPTVTVGGTYSATDFSVLRISPELSGIVGITSVYLINAGTNSGTANAGTHTRLFSVNNSGSTQMAGGIVVGSILTAAVGGTYYGFLNDGALSSVSTMATLNHGSTGTPAAGFGTDLLYLLESDSTANQDAGALRVAWTTETQANRTAAFYVKLVNNAATFSTQPAQLTLSGAGGLSIGDPAQNTLPVGVINAFTGFRANNAAPLAQFLRGNGTNFVASAIQLTDLPAGSGVTFDNPTALVSTAAVNGVATTAMRSDAAPAIDQGMGPTWTGGHTWNLGTTSPLAAISLDIAALGAAGTRDSHAIFLRGRSHDGTPHNIDWQYWVNATSNAGASYFTLEQRIDAAAYASRLNIYSTGLVEVPSLNIGVTQSDTYGIVIANTQPAIAGAANQQWSGPMRWEGQGWESAVGTSMKTEFRQYIAPVQGVAAPTVYWVMEHSVNDATYVEIMRADSTGYVRITKNALASIDTTLGQSAFGLQINNDTAATAVTTTQDAPPVVFKLAAWNSSALTSQDWRWRMLAKGVTVAGTTTSYLRIDSGISGSNFGNPLVFYSSGGASLGSVLAEQPLGVLSVQVGFRIAGGAASGQFLRGNGTNFISAAIGAGDVPAAAMTHVMLNTAVHTDTLTAAVARGALIVANSTPLWARLVVDTANRVLTNNGTDTAWGKVDLAATTNISGILAIANGGTNASSFTSRGIVYYDAATTSLKNRVSATQYMEYTGNVYQTIRYDENASGIRLSLDNYDTTASANAGVKLVGALSATDSNSHVAGYVEFAKEQTWTSTASTQDGMVQINSLLGGTGAVALGIRASGSIICGKGDNTTTRVGDFLHIVSCAGTPTGVPTLYGNYIPMTVDDTSATKKLWLYVAGAWIGVVIV